jgi:hypothetical protein
MNGSDTCTRIGSSLIAALCTIAVVEPAQAQTYPSRTIGTRRRRAGSLLRLCSADRNVRKLEVASRPCGTRPLQRLERG